MATRSVQRRIVETSGQIVLFDRVPAEIHDLTTERLNQQVNRNLDRFPSDLAFRLSKNETSELVANCDRFRNLNLLIEK